MASIMKKVNGFAASPAGQAKIQHYMEGQLANGKRTTASGAKIISQDRMMAAADEFIRIMGKTWMSYSLPTSVEKHISEMTVGSARMTVSGMELPLFFVGDLHRDSLLAATDYESYSGEWGAYTGDGIDNIVALFNNGYHASAHVYGWWESHADGAFTKSRWIRSRKDREALHFIQQAADDFNANYGSKYNVTVSIADIYER
jgi:hypothetical protein